MNLFSPPMQMSRENAIKFLRDISMGIDYLENAYSANRQGDISEDNNSIKVSEKKKVRFYPLIVIDAYKVDA